MELEFEVVKGFLSPWDKARKSARRAVVLARKGGFVVVAPATTYTARTGTVPAGHVLLTTRSAAYARSGFDAEVVAISIRDAVAVREDSVWMAEAVRVGKLRLSEDKRLADNFKMVLREFPPCKIVESD